MDHSTPDASRITVVSFDLWLTLIKSNTTPNKATRAAALYDLLDMDRHGISLDDFTVAVKDAEKVGDIRSENGEKHYGPYERTLLVADHYGVPMLDASAFKAFYAAQAERLFTYPPMLMQDDLPDVLAKLAGRYELALMSNTGFMNGVEMRRILEAIGILKYFTYQIFSDEVGVNKPHPKIFRHLLSISGAEASQVVHVGDNRSADYEGADAVGIHGVHLPSTLTVRDAVSFLF